MKKQLLALAAAVSMAATAAYAQDVTYVPNPPSESQLTELASFDITFDTPMKVDEPQSVMVYRDGVRIDASVGCSVSEDKLTVTYTLNPTQTLDGRYTFRLLDYAACPVSNQLYTPYLDIVYYIGEPRELDPVVTSNPAIGSTNEWLDDFLLMFENVNTLAIDASKRVYLTDGTKEWPYHISDESVGHDVIVMARPDDTELMLREGGEYWLVIEEGALVLNGKPYGFRLDYNISKKLQLVTVDPAEGNVSVSDLENITLTFNMEIKSITSYMVQALQIYQIDEEGQFGESVGAYIPTIDAADHKVVHLQADGELEIYESGEYVINVPPTLVRADGQSNTSITLTYNVNTTGIQAVAVDSASEIYTLCGVKVANGQLTPGIYVINGKKTLVK